MSTPLFNPDGVAQKVSELYALSDQQLAYEAEQIRTDFIEWVSANFALTPSQSDYLNQILDADFRNLLSNQLSAAVHDRIPVSLDQEGDPEKITTKRFDLTNNIKMLQSPNKPPVRTGGIQLRIKFDN